MALSTLPILSATVWQPTPYGDWEYTMFEVEVSAEDWNLATELSAPIVACDCACQQGCDCEDGYCACDEECER
jgi:hypothetical protein